MDTESRRKKIVETLSHNDTPINASKLAKEFDVSRQIIVGDVAILRAEGYEIEATSRGYLLAKNQRYGYIGIIAACHGKDRIREELNTIVDYGGTCIDVSVEHIVYGELTGLLNISSRYQVEEFISQIEKDGKPLSYLSEGVHLHKIGTESQEIFELIKKDLDEKDLLYKN